MAGLLDPFTTLNHPDLFSLMWVGSIVIVFGGIVVYNVAIRRYRRYPVILALHEWVFWSIIVTWGVVPLLVVVHVPLILTLAVIFGGMGIAVYAAWVKFPPLIGAANDELRLRRFVPPAHRDARERRRETPAGGRRRHRR